MKFYEEVSENYVTKLFEELDKLKSYKLEDKDTCDSLIAVYEYNANAIKNEFKNIMIDPKNKELIKD